MVFTSGLVLKKAISAKRKRHRHLETMRKSCFIVSFLLVVLSSASVIPVLVVKLPRSGSTWFTEMLNKYVSTPFVTIAHEFTSSFRIPWLYISKEVVQHRDVGEFSFAQIEQHLRNALIRPTDKLAAAGRLLPTGRFMEDFVTNLKMLSSLKAVGVSLNVEHVRGKPPSALGLLHSFHIIQASIGATFFITCHLFALLCWKGQISSS